MSRDVSIASEGNILVGGDLYGKYIYPSSASQAAKVLEMPKEKFVNSLSSSNTSQKDCKAE